MIVPSLVKRETMFGTGYLPQGEEDLYRTQDSEYLVGTVKCRRWVIMLTKFWTKKICRKNFCVFRRVSEEKPGATGKM